MGSGGGSADGIIEADNWISIGDEFTGAQVRKVFTRSTWLFQRTLGSDESGSAR